MCAQCHQNLNSKRLRKKGKKRKKKQNRQKDGGGVEEGKLRSRRCIPQCLRHFLLVFSLEFAVRIWQLGIDATVMRGLTVKLKVNQRRQSECQGQLKLAADGKAKNLQAKAKTKAKG